MATSAQTMTASRAWTFTRCGGVAGIIGVVLFVIGIVMVVSAPTVNDSITDTRAWWQDNGQRWLWSSTIIGVGIILFLLPFVVALRRYLAVKGDAALGTIAVLGVIFWFLLGASASAFDAVLALAIDQLDNDSVVRALQWGDYAGFSSNSLALVPFFGAVAAVFWNSRRWLSLLCAALAVLSFIGTFGIVTADPESPLAILGLVSTAGFGVVTLVLSAFMLMDEA